MEDSYYKEYFKREEKDWWFNGREKIVLSVLKPFFSERKNWVIGDIGSGSGRILDKLQLYGTVVGVDNSPLAVEFCQKKKRNVFLGDASHLEFPDSSFNLITMLEVLEHLEGEKAALKEARRVLKRKGLLILTVPAFPFLWGSHDLVSHHKRRYSKGELKRKLENEGFQIVKVSYFNSYLFPVVAVVRLFRRLTKSRKLQSDFLNLPPTLNWLLERMFSSERYLLRWVSLPFGVSLLVLARKK